METHPMNACAEAPHPRSHQSNGANLIRLYLVLTTVTLHSGCASGDTAVADHAESTVRPTVSGHVYDAAGAPLPGVRISIDAAGCSTSTDAAGAYVLSVPFGTAGAIRPTLGRYEFCPQAWSFSELKRDLDGIDFRTKGPCGPRDSLEHRGFTTTRRGAAPNRPPQAFNQSVETNEGTSATIALSGSDADGDRLTYIITMLPRYGRLSDAHSGHTIAVDDLPYTLPGGKCVYQPARHYRTGTHRAEVLAFHVWDGTDRSPDATVDIAVRSVGDPPSRGIPAADPQKTVVHVNTPRFVVLTGKDGAGRSSLEPLGAPLTFCVLAQPDHGTLYGTPPELVYVPNADYRGLDRFSFRVNDGTHDSPPASVAIHVTEWEPPVGIPAPPFGIHDTHLMYAEATYDFGSGPEPYPDAGNGPYTHYVDNAHPDATDTDNPYGTAALPRLTLPIALPSGSVVEVHGGVVQPYTYPLRDMWIDADGTPSRPIFIRGVRDTRGRLPRFDRYLRPRAAYLIVEQLCLDGTATGEGIFRVIDPADRVVLRHCEIVGGEDSGVQLVAKYHLASVTHVVVYNNKISGLGDWLADYDQDYHGIAVNVHEPHCQVAHLWLIDNEFFHCSGNGIQINATAPELQARLHHVYIGRNSFHHNKQRGVGIKESEHVIVSENVSHACRPVGENPSNPGDAMGANYGPDNVWFLYNKLYGCDNGIRYSSGDNGAGANLYIIGNLIYDIRHSEVDLTGQWPVEYDPADPWSPGKAIAIWNPTGAKHVINNTIYRCDAGVYVTYNLEQPVIIANNVIADVDDGTGETQHIRLFQTRTASVSLVLNNLLGHPARIRWGQTSGGPVYDVAGLENAYPENAWNNREADPLFIDPNAVDLRLEATSPGIDAGVVYEAYETFRELYGLDIAVGCSGVYRPQDGDASGTAEYDAGAFERASDWVYKTRREALIPPAPGRGD